MKGYSFNRYIVECKSIAWITRDNVTKVLIDT